MIRQLTGTIVDVGLNYVVLDVGGVGYLIHTNNPAQHLLETTTRFFTHLAVRDNALDLYGFADRDTLEIFGLLIELPKIGPKSALQILTAADIQLLKEAVQNNDPAYLSKLSGIGKKSAEKIVTGLKDKFDSQGYDALPIERNGAYEQGHMTDTIDALIALGYPAFDARRVVIEITTADPSLSSSNEVIKLALRALNVER
ncbi:Holliday junction branch migration protein RuvA [Candidatus Nomurabacteria bacterium]|nr:Holliday junction branch migration protein RuvA [Candidatus Nomurabacteria bacterium]